MRALGRKGGAERIRGWGLVHSCKRTQTWSDQPNARPSISACVVSHDVAGQLRNIAGEKVQGDPHFVVGADKLRDRLVRLDRFYGCCGADLQRQQRIAQPGCSPGGGDHGEREPKSTRARSYVGEAGSVGSQRRLRLHSRSRLRLEDSIFRTSQSAPAQPVRPMFARLNSLRSRRIWKRCSPTLHASPT